MPELSPNTEKLSFDDVERVVTKEVFAAQEFTELRVPKRETSWDRYYGRPLGNEVNGRSKFITRDLLETIESIMPFLIKLFASGDAKIDIKIVGQEPWVGKALMKKIQLDLENSTPNLFSVFYQWFKDALVSDTAFVKLAWDLDHETVNVDFDELQAEQMQQLVDDPDVQISQIEDSALSLDDNENVIFSGIKAKVKKIIKNGLYIENTPHWEFIVSKRSRSINDEHGKGQRTQVTVDYLKRISRANTQTGGEPYFKNLDRLESGESKAESDATESEKESYMNKGTTINTDIETGAKASVDLTEWYTRLDIDGDGYLENVVCYLGNGYLLKYELNEEDFIPFSSLSPIMDCYKFFGISYSDLLVEIQNLKTMMFRRILDNFNFQNAGRWLKDPNSGIDPYALLNNSPGSVITGKIGGLQDITPAPFNPSSLSILEYVDTIKENRTGVTRYSQGTDANSLNKTATGISLIQNAAMQRLELIARIFAELGLKDFYRKVSLLYQKYIRQPFSAKVLGQEREVTSEMLQGQVVTTVDMGVVATVGAEETAKLERVLDILLRVNEVFPGLLTPEAVHNLMARYISASGFNDVDGFIGDVKEYIQKAAEGQQEQSEMQQAMLKMEQKFKEMELQIKAQDSQTKAEKVTQDGQVDMARIAQDGQIDMVKIEQDGQIAGAEIEQKREDSRAGHELEAIKIDNEERTNANAARGTGIGRED